MLAAMLASARRQVNATARRPMLPSSAQPTFALALVHSSAKTRRGLARFIQVAACGTWSQGRSWPEQTFESHSSISVGNSPCIKLSVLGRRGALTWNWPAETISKQYAVTQVLCLPAAPCIMDRIEPQRPAIDAGRSEQCRVNQAIGIDESYHRRTKDRR